MRRKEELFPVRPKKKKKAFSLTEYRPPPENS